VNTMSPPLSPEPGHPDRILGLDVGGTQTDAVLIGPAGVIASTKTPTREDLLDTLRKAVEATLSGETPERMGRLAFSTTMATNAIVQDQLVPTGMIVSAGPGMDPHGFAVGPSYHVVQGCLDHRGFEAKPLDRQEVMEAADRIQAQGIRTAGVVSKFSTRNPSHEFQIAEWIAPFFSHVALGHTVSGNLGFPRRIATTYLNAALHESHQGFVDALLRILEEQGLHAPRYLLKPDGGTVGLEESRSFPARTAQSGPAASVMGALALDPCEGTTLVLDVGGTTTDIAVIYNGAPLLEPYGIRLGPYLTQIRSLQTRSVGIGGDSAVLAEPGRALRIGPRRQGPPRAFGGPAPTPTDAMVVLGLLNGGDPKAAHAAMADVAGVLGTTPKKAAQAVLDRTAELIADSVHAFLHFINSRPVYTVREVLEGTILAPTGLVLIGGPASQLKGPVERALSLPCRVPPHAEVANAIGAAVSRVTAQVTLQADTTRGSVIIPEADLQQGIDAGFNMDQGLDLARETLRKIVLAAGTVDADPEFTVTEQQTFTMIQGFSRTGRNIRLKMGITPGIIPEWKRSA
jgi:N-methylhydantoinase A